MSNGGQFQMTHFGPCVFIDQAEVFRIEGSDCMYHDEIRGAKTISASFRYSSWIASSSSPIFRTLCDSCDAKDAVIEQF